MKRVWIALAVVCLAACHNEAPTTTTPPPENEPPPFVAGTESWVTTSAITNRKYQITVALPSDYTTNDHAYPVLYATDANFHFGTLVETARLMRFDKLIPELIVVGIGYPVGYGMNTVGPRPVDLTPTPDSAWMESAMRDFPKNGWPTPEGSGGGPGFLRFIREEVIPSVEKKYRANRMDRAYYGFSFGGLFGVYALLNNEGTFSRFIIGSPSLWWNNRTMFEAEKAYAAMATSLPARVFFSVGLEEETEYPASSDFRMVANLREFVRVLNQRKYEGLNIGVHYFDGERHNSVGGATISRGLRFIYGDAAP